MAVNFTSILFLVSDRFLLVFELSCTTASSLLGCLFLYMDGGRVPQLQLPLYMLVCWRQSSKRFVLGARNLQFPDILFHPQRELRFNAFTSYTTSRHWVTNCQSLLLYTQGDAFKMVSSDTFSLSTCLRMNHPVLPHLLFKELTLTIAQCTALLLHVNSDFTFFPVLFVDYITPLSI